MRLPITVSGLLTPDDCIAALKAVGKWRVWWIPSLALLGIALIGANLPAVRGGAGRVGLTMILLAGLFLLTYPLRMRRRFVRTWQARTEFSHPVSWTFADDGLLTETVNAKNFRDWNGFAYAKITPRQIVLSYPGNAMFSFVPKRFFTDDDWTCVCQHLNMKLTVKD